MKFKRFQKNFFIIIGIDIIFLTGSLYLSHLIRFDFNIPVEFWHPLKRILPLILIIKILCFYYFDLYRGMWRYTSIIDLFNVIKASTISLLVIISFILFSTRFERFSRSVFIIDWCFTVLFISGLRLIVRFYFERFGKDESWTDSFHAFIKNAFIKRKDKSKNLLIIGAGDCGEKIFREIRDNAGLLYNVVGFLDDNPVKAGKKIHGVSVLGNISNIKIFAEKTDADEALIAISSADAFQMQKIVKHCRESGLKFKTVPSYGELINGEVTINAIREVNYRDLLGREQIILDEKEIGAYLKRQTVLITGAGGSIGSELCRQVCRFQPESIVLYERAESPLYEIELELKKNFSHVKIIPLLADIMDIRQLEKTFEAFGPRVVFHAAAYKHVPMLELQPWKAMENNILGTENLVKTSKKFKIERFVFVSTDKAVRPVSVMGASKRMAEMLIENQNSSDSSDTRFMIVRFGNVAGSAGSVIPLFKKQIEDGGPVTVTHPDVTRYFMTIPEACQLVLQAGAMGCGGEIFVLNMGTPIKIYDMATDLIRLSGFEPGVDIKIEYIGLRPGEKLYEELITDDEGILPTGHKKIMVLKGTEHNNLRLINEKIKELTEFSDIQDKEKIRIKLQEILPEYKPAIN